MFQKLLFIGLLAITLSGCASEFTKILASDDTNAKYQAANNYYSDGKYENAKLLYDQIRGFYRSSPEFETILYNYAYSNYNLKEYVLAGHYFNQYANTYRNTEKTEEAEFMSAYSNYIQSPNYRLDQEATTEAIDQFQDFINKYPSSPKMAQCNEIIDELRRKLEVKAFEAAYLYHKIEDHKSAIAAFDNILKEYPDTEDSEKIRYFMFKSAYELAEQSIITKQKERYQSAIKYGELFLKKYSMSKYGEEVVSLLSSSKVRIKNLEDNVRN